MRREGWLGAALFLSVAQPGCGPAPLQTPLADGEDFVATAAGCATLFPGVTPPAGMTDQCDATFQGVRRLVRSKTGLKLHVVLVDLQHPDVRIETALARDTFGPGVEAVKAMAVRHRAAVAINSDYFNGSVGPPQGTVALFGDCYKAHPGRSALLFSANQRQTDLGRFGSWPVRAGTCPRWTFHAAGGGPPIIEAGTIIKPWRVTAQGTSGLSTINGDTDFPTANVDWWSKSRNAYSVGGLSADGRTLALAACDNCLLVDELAPLVRAVGIPRAMKLDSGSATALMYDGQLFGTERQVAASLMVHSARAACPATVEAGCRCFAPTGHTVCGRLLTFWDQNGGLPVFGYPISVELGEPSAGKLYRTQWFERHRFELHPENAPPYDVLLGLLGRARLPSRGAACTPTQPLPPGTGRLVPETGFTIPAIFDRYYRSQGLEFDGAAGKSLAESLALFGFPISPATGERFPDGKCLWTQYFERVRFEYHPELPASSQILLGLLGRETLANR